MLLYELWKLLVINSFAVLLNYRWLFYRVATGMSPLGGGTGRTPRTTEDFCHLFISEK